ncbi:MAG: glycine cleavage system aminomethyltransferase GcvT, partial [Chloroflexaceae bacterium]|nr:glycine cleavage system aminomethyltransferase GcvT [Chloroflexaceae bacterium]
MLKRTPLFEAHRAAGARMVEFGGWEMPVQYSGIIEEHHAVRQGAGLFDIS